MWTAADFKPTTNTPYSSPAIARRRRGRPPKAPLPLRHIFGKGRGSSSNNSNNNNNHNQTHTPSRLSAVQSITMAEEEDEASRAAQAFLAQLGHAASGQSSSKQFEMPSTSASAGQQDGRGEVMDNQMHHDRGGEDSNTNANVNVNADADADVDSISYDLAQHFAQSNNSPHLRHHNQPRSHLEGHSQNHGNGHGNGSGSGIGESSDQDGHEIRTGKPLVTGGCDVCNRTQTTVWRKIAVNGVEKKVCNGECPCIASLSGSQNQSRACRISAYQVQQDTTIWADDSLWTVPRQIRYRPSTRIMG
jgi:hypothetical protein